jgi:hypothetical protein
MEVSDQLHDPAALYPRKKVLMHIGQEVGLVQSRSVCKRPIQKFPDWVDNEINNNNKHSLRSNTKVYGGKTH